MCKIESKTKESEDRKAINNIKPQVFTNSSIFQKNGNIRLKESQLAKVNVWTRVKTTKENQK